MVTFWRDWDDYKHYNLVTMTLSSYYVKSSRGRGLRAMSGLNCELYRLCLSSAIGSDATAAAPPCILASTCSARCLSCCSRRIRSARNSSMLLLFAGLALSLLCRWWLWRTPCTKAWLKIYVTSKLFSYNKMQGKTVKKLLAKTSYVQHCYQA